MAGLSKFFVKLAMDNAGFLKAVNEAGKGVDNFKKKGKNVGNMFAGFGGGGGLKGLTMFTGKIAGIAKLMQLANQTIKEGVRTNVAFEKSLSMLAGISGTSVRNIKELENEARRLGATTAYTAAEVVALETELAKLGFSRKEILNSTEAVLKFSLATGSGLSEAAALAGSALRSFGADSSEMGRYVSAMAISTTKSALSFDFLQNAMSTVAPVAKSYGFAIEDVLALLGTLADAGFDASAAATATRNIFLYLADASGKLSKQLGEPVRTLPELVAGLKKLKDSGVDLGEALELTDKRSVAVFSTFLDNTDKILGLQKALTGVEGELDKMAATMADNVDGALKGLSSAWEGLTLAFSKGNGVLKKTIDFLTDIVRIITPEHMSRIEKLMQGTGVEWRKEEEKEEEKSNQTDADVAKKYADNLKAEVERKIKSGSTRDAAIADVVTPARDNQKKYLDDARQKLKELAQQGDDLEKVIAKRRKEFNRVAPVNQHEYAEGTYERLAQLEKLAAKIEETKKLIAAYEAQEKALNAAFTDQPEEQKKEIKIPESEIKEEIERLKKELMTNPNLSVQVKVGYLNRIDELEKALNEGKKKAYKLSEEIAGEQGRLLSAALGNDNYAGTGRGETGQKIAAAKEGAKVKNAKQRGKELEVPSYVASTEQEDEGLIKNNGSIAAAEEKVRKLRYEFEIVGTKEGRDKLGKEIKEAEKELAALQPPTAMEIFGQVGDAIGDIDNLAGAFERLQKVIDEDGSAWEKFMAGFSVVQSIVGGVQSVIKVVEMLSLVSQGAAVAAEAQGAAEVASTTAEVTGAMATAEANVLKTIATRASTSANYGNAVTGAAASVAATPFIGPALAAAAAGETAALLAPFLAFAKGGLVPGASPAGDKLLARLNSGEMILNKAQQAHLWGMLHGGQAVTGDISGGQQKKLFSEIAGKSAMPAFSSGGIAGASMFTYNIPAVYAPDTMATTAHHGANVPAAGAMKLDADVRFEIDGEKLVGVLKRRERRLSNA